MNCNSSAFHWIIEFVKIQTNSDEKIEMMQDSEAGINSHKKLEIQHELEADLYMKMDDIDNENCLNILVTSYFLQLTWVYNKVWDYYFSRNFSEVIN